jgi:nickel superoxide dismutase
MNLSARITVTAIMVTTAALFVSAHCEIPCGIYDDPLRITLLNEHITTIEKSMKQVVELSQAKEKNYNQLVRWISNKETHADSFMHIVTQYFMTQRIKPPNGGDKQQQVKYLHELTLLHKMLIHAMKAKQTTDLEHCTTLRTLVEEFKASYLGKPKEEVMHHES